MLRAFRARNTITKKITCSATEEITLVSQSGNLERNENHQLNGLEHLGTCD